MAEPDRIEIDGKSIVALAFICMENVPEKPDEEAPHIRGVVNTSA